ncbi:polyadenylate-binding protein-interacting protein 4 isoform X2 [Jatropha curcas]|uniref:polyadenylate-binding protein-interacting protein 4 isoform X2 n=1 Tax=Jatropha curcas TaxID=180498 RepID=UPI0009D707B1|nr:polyadenylate-binding protein-interacting protein 4 isoform X2 [Jatropha curcas]
MGYKNRAETETENCLSDALLFATMCIIGLPVDVHVRDGSVYSGIFHTASVDKDYGIVLKEAKLTKKGKYDANVANGSVIETLVILSGDLVQVVAKEILFAADGITGNGASDDVEASVANVSSCEVVMCEAKESNRSDVDKKKIHLNRISTKNKNNSDNGLMPTKAGKEEGRKISTNHTETATEVEHGKINGVNILKSEEASDALVIGRQIGDDESQREQDHQKKKFGLQRKTSDDEDQSSSSISGSCLSEAKAAEEGQMMVKLLPNGVSCDPTPTFVKLDNQCCVRSASAGTSSPTAVCSSISTASSPLIEFASDSHSVSLASSADMVSMQSSESTKSSKEFKLNPGAKIFCPSFASPASASAAVPTVTSMAYVPSHSPMVPVATVTQPEVGMSPFVPRPSVPAKFSPYTNLATVNGGSGPQFSQPIVGHMGNRTQPLRYAGQYHAVQTAPAYVPPNSQAVMVGRLGQLVYVQPVSHDLVQNTATISPLSARSLLTSHQVQYPKHQGSAAGQALQLCAPPPFVAGGQQSFAMPSHIPLLQPPIPANRPIPVPGSNALFGAKFP